MDPKTVAECLTQLEWDLLMRISHRELLHKRFSSEEQAPNIHACKDFFNHVSRWMVLQVIMAEGGPKKRAEVLSHLIRITLQFRELHNFSGILQVRAKPGRLFLGACIHTYIYVCVCVYV
jgi:RasGEF domain